MFAGHREAAGKANVEVDVAEGSTAGELAEKIVGMYPSIAGDPSRLVVAVNQEFAEHTQILAVGDEVALIPPVSGGAR